MSSVPATTVAPASSMAGSAAAVSGARTWLVGPWFDLLFVANLLWPLAMLTQFIDVPWMTQPLGLFQLYFLSSPHRWITLLLVFCDPDRFWKEPIRFGGIGLGLVAIGGVLVAIGSSMPSLTNSLVLLMILDYAWNSWHFAAQHAGISRIYGRLSKSEGDSQAIVFEKMAIRTLVLWTFVRLAVHVGAAKPDLQLGTDFVRSLDAWLMWGDPILVLPIAILLYRELQTYHSACLGKIIYVGSLATLYISQLVAMQLHQNRLLGGLFIAGAIFHATEYLAVVNWSVQKKTSGLWRYHLPRTGAGVLVFMIIIGIANMIVDHRSAFAWALATLLVSLLHYGYDGMIWKARPKPTAAAT